MSRFQPESLRSHIEDLGTVVAPELREFALAYFDSADLEELSSRSPSQLLAIARSHIGLLESCYHELSPGVRVFNPDQAEDGFVSEHTVIQIVHDDKPFLVDSVTMAVNRSGRTALWIIHPLLMVDLDDQGRLCSTTSAGAQGHSCLSTKSFIFVECDRIVSAQAREDLVSELIRTLSDVDAAVHDWPAMLARLDSASPPEPQGATLAQQEGIEFLRWLKDKHFTFLGSREYLLERSEGAIRLVAKPGTGLGLLRGEAKTPVSELPVQTHAQIDSEQWVLVTKAMTRSTVHRPAWLDCISVKQFDPNGKVVGESRFLGLYTSRAYAASVLDIPHVRRMAAMVMQAAMFVPDSHAAKSLQVILDTYPRDEMLQMEPTVLVDHAIGILRLQMRQRTRLFVRRDPFGRFTSVLVFVPRDRYNTELRTRIGRELMQALDGVSVEFTPMLTDHPLARIHYLVRARLMAPDQPDIAGLEVRVARLARRWQDDCRSTLLQLHGEQRGLTLGQRFADAFPNAYRDDFSGAVAADDIATLMQLSEQTTIAVKLYRPIDATGTDLRLKVFHSTKVDLSDSLPMLERMGARVLDERPYRIRDAASAEFWIHDLGLQLPVGASFPGFKQRFESLFVKVWLGEIDSDDLNKLVLVTPLDARQISIIRAYTRYFKQLGFAYSQSYIEATLYKNANVVELLADLFSARFNPVEQAVDRQISQNTLIGHIESMLTNVASLDEDRILRQFMGAILATLRTNAWQTLDSGTAKPYLSFKFNSREFPGLVEPRPMAEIWVYSPRVEGLHLRNGRVARGGIRWSDRRDDFRTEILGLVKAQHVKNTVIVPVGSKGGFVLKCPPSPPDRQAMQNEGIACYRTFLCGLLDLTDNLVRGEVQPPPDVVRHDGDDPYLVVAADKGTASFSDIANSISADYGYWLGDAFASGGSVGYDHKKMGITARGAWEAAKRHFRMLGRNIQDSPFTVMGIGDMSGDVFGNGMLLSTQIRLVAAFDHRHIFIDPDPDIARSFGERRRLFEMAGSSWNDFDRTVISTGGGVFSRSAKSVSLSEQARAVLGIAASELSPAELLRALLLAPVDMIYNGGIGTYVKASSETHQQAGDKAADAYRVDGRELRCKVLVEGGNLGCTQLGRIEFAQSGGLIYTDAIDNSAGVDCSDHEVNIKILLDRVVEHGDLTLKQRNELLASMTEDVGRHVLTDNYYQTQALDVACHRPLYVLDAQQRLMQRLERAGRLQRAIEFLPDDDEIARRRAMRLGLTAPEGAVVLAYAKMAVFDDLLASNLPDDPYFEITLRAYFPAALAAAYDQAIASHPLRREIIGTFVTNTVINRTGATFISFLATESGASTADVVRAYTLAREIFDLEPLWDQIDALDLQVQATLQLDLLCQLTSIAQRAARWILRLRAKGTDMPSLIARYRPAALEMRTLLNQWLPEHACQRWHHAALALQQSGVPESLAFDLTALEHVFPALDLVDLAAKAEVDLAHAVRAYHAVAGALTLDGWQALIKRLPTATLWQTQARSSARDDLNAIVHVITQDVLAGYPDASSWLHAHAANLVDLRQLQQEVSAQAPDLAPMTVALRAMRHLT